MQKKNFYSFAPIFLFTKQHRIRLAPAALSINTFNKTALFSLEI